MTEADDRSNWDPEVLALRAVVLTRLAKAWDEIMTGVRGPISLAMRERGIIADERTIEAVFGWMFWDGVRAGIEAVHSAGGRAWLLDEAFLLPGFEDR